MRVKSWSSVVLALMLCGVVILAGCSGSKGSSNNGATGTDTGGKQKRQTRHSPHRIH